jgi:Transglycosylase SLT domain/Peptidase family M23
MNRRTLLIGSAVACAAFAAAVFPASADPVTVTVTLLGGKTISVTADVDPCTGHVSLPDLPGPVTNVQVPSLPCPQKEQPPSSGDQQQTQPQQTQPQATTPTETTSKQDSGKPQAKDKGSRQKTTNGGTKDKAESEKKASSDSSSSDSSSSDSSHKRADHKADRGSGGAPTASNPTLSVASVGPAPVGVPNFFIDKFRIPPFLLPIYQAAGIQYNIPWQVLAAINEIETDYGRNLSVSSAGALGWMQFMPASWRSYGVDANNDRRKDPYNPVDAIFAAARYLRAADGDKDIRKAVFSYNHADWYVDSVMLRAKLIGGLPGGLVGSLTGLTQGHFPVHARARYADDVSEQATKTRYHKGQNAAQVVDSNVHRRSINIFSRKGAPVIASQDGQVRRIGTSKKLGKYLILQDAYGNRYTYAHLGSVQADYPAPKPQTISKTQVQEELKLPKDPTPNEAASAGSQKQPKVHAKAAAKKGARGTKARTPAKPAPAAAPTVSVEKERLYAHPARGDAYKAGGKQQLFESGNLPGFTTFKDYFTQVFGLNRSDVELKPLHKGAHMIAGTILGRVGEQDQASPHISFSIQPAGRGAPKIDPKPILDGWKLLESTAVYRAAGKNPFFGSDGQTATVGQILLMSKEQLEQRVLADPRIDIYEGGRNDIKGGEIDRRVLATMEYLASSGLKPTISCLKTGHSLLTSSGNVSEHVSGNAVDVAAVNGIPILGHQGKGSITDLTIQRLLSLQGTMKPHQIISLMTPEDFGGADNVMALSDHDDHIHIGFHPMYNTSSGEGALKPGQWLKLIDRLSNIDNPTVPVKPSKDAIPVKRGSTDGE